MTAALPTTARPSAVAPVDHRVAPSQSGRRHRGDAHPPQHLVEVPARAAAARRAKRVVDVCVSLALLLALSPLLLVTALAVRLDSRGPVLFRQQRCGLDGDEFTMLKFRSMSTGARDPLTDRHDGAGPLFKLHDDPRVTRVGRVIRRYSVDELPQLVNVLRGDMSLVGPRPALPREVAQYDEVARRRLLVLPGLTGPWQVGGRSDLDWETSIALDLGYVHRWTPTTDPLILVKTVGAVLRPVGAY
ncbi:sugar transferase [Frigoribacterium faeni]|uniref:sugar transferase n=1 Tax=Frigoribacterium faeni TaxID=145483 RepID=UPI00141B5204|nr:sugar transferase [Frigoribacterium faeni]NIJ05546.1 lipopolysaccharide/colanic/teichoic acid biosynthesis glycosyltransferase [Frigoribacterium faeni]